MEGVKKTYYPLDAQKVIQSLVGKTGGGKKA